MQNNRSCKNRLNESVSYLIAFQDNERRSGNKPGVLGVASIAADPHIAKGNSIQWIGHYATHENEAQHSACSHQGYKC